MSLLPYAWAKAQRALLRPGEHGATLLVSPRTPGWAISEVRQRHAPPLQQVEQVRQDPVAAAIQVRHLVLAHPHGQVPPDEAALGEVDDERGRVEPG